MDVTSPIPYPIQAAASLQLHSHCYRQYCVVEDVGGGVLTGKEDDHHHPYTSVVGSDDNYSRILPLFRLLHCARCRDVSSCYHLPVFVEN